MSANLEVGMRGILFDGEAFFLAILHILDYYLLKILFDAEAFFWATFFGNLAYP